MCARWAGNFEPFGMGTGVCIVAACPVLSIAVTGNIGRHGAEGAKHPLGASNRCGAAGPFPVAAMGTS